MGRAKLNLELISKEKSRHITFQKRKKGLTKKIYEFKTLCDVKACMIMYGPNTSNRAVELETWPPADPAAVRDIALEYKAQSKEDRARRTTDLSDFFKDRKKKVDVELAKVRRTIGASRFPPWDPRLDRLDPDQLAQVAGSLDAKIVEARDRLEWLKGKSITNPLPLPLPHQALIEYGQAGASTAPGGLVDFSPLPLPLPAIYFNNMDFNFELKPEQQQQYYSPLEIQQHPLYGPAPLAQLPPPSFEAGFGGGYSTWFGPPGGGGGRMGGGLQYPMWRGTTAETMAPAQYNYGGGGDQVGSFMETFKY